MLTSFIKSCVIQGEFRFEKPPGWIWLSVYPLKDPWVVALHLGLETWRRFEVRQLGGVCAEVTGDLAAGGSRTHAEQIGLCVRQTLRVNTTISVFLCIVSPPGGSGGWELTHSLSEAEERRDLLLLWHLSWLLMSEVWLVTVERRVDKKLLLVERRSRWWTQRRTPRHGMYLAKANLVEVRRSLESRVS